MKNPLHILLLAILLTSCQESITMGYDETMNDPILETDLDKSPKENVEAFLADAGVNANSITIYSNEEKSCECAKNGMDCLCKLGNAGLSSHSCGDAEQLCGKTKYIEVDVASGDADKLSSIGFDRVGGSE